MISPHVITASALRGIAVSVASVMAIALCVNVAGADEAWFLPYEPDEHTIVLYHLDGEGEAEPAGEGEGEANEAAAEIELVMHGGAVRGPGAFGQAVHLRGPKEHLRLTKNAALSLGNAQPFTVEMWMRADSPEASIFSIGTRFYLKGHFSRSTATLGYRAESFPIRWVPMAGVSWPRREWMHVALTHDEDRQVKLYINGRLIASAEHGDEGDYAGSSTAAFGAHDGWSTFLKGAMDEIRISDNVREFAPLLTQAAYLAGERVRLNLGGVTLPDEVARVRVALVRGGEELASEERAVAQAGEELMEAAAIGAEPASAIVSFLDAEGAVVGSVAQPVRYVGEQVDEQRARAEACRAALAGADDSLPETALAQLFLDEAASAWEARKFEMAEGVVAAAERAAHRIASGEAAYRAAVRARVRAGERDDELRVTMSWNADDAAAALPWAERVGANELVSSSRSTTREGLQTWQDAGYHTGILSSVPIHSADPKEHPDHRQFGYWYIDSAPAAEESIRVRLTPPAWGGLEVSDFFGPAEHWLVLDQERGEELGVDRWSFDKGKNEVQISGAEAGHVYRVYYMMHTAHMGDPLYEPFAEYGLQALDELIAPFEGVLETYWFDDLGYAWPGANAQGSSDWESYTNAARPENQEAFTAETGIEFDPRWLVLAPRTLNVPPPDEYVAWMRWVQSKVKPWMARATEVVRQRGARSWLYWGDAHVGIEPYMGSLTEGRVEEIDKPAGDPVTARALVDFPGDVYRRLRVEWLHGHVVGRADGEALLRRRWTNCQRGMLMEPAQGIYWMPMPQVAGQPQESVREGGTQAVAQISDEFRLIGKTLGGQRAWEGGLNLYVVHSWGAQYSWRPWGSPVLWHLTDLPVRVQFVSFAEVAAGGVPADADCVLLYGMPNSAWSGGPAWEDDALAEAVRGFVAGGGGLVAMQAPSHVEDPEPRWALSDLMGVTGEGAMGYEQAQTTGSGDEWVDVEALDAAREERGLSLVRTDEVYTGAEAPSHVPAMTGTIRAATVSDDVHVPWALETDEGGWLPGVAYRQAGEGRSVWLCGYSADYGFSRLLRSAIFWAAGREAEAARLDATGGEGLFVYAYPEARVVALLNASDEPVQATVRCAPEILGLPAGAKCRVTDVATGEEIGAAVDLGEGLEVTAVPRCVRLLSVGM